ncbi:MAG: hypothetical protein D8M57_12710 [Candidatus Scalindua sp. AMX11]|nr:MAG: hypothetical protein DWQ00_12230 [Candidatus Scalindua sp.]NOG83837.1 hypothetical protein [Planctomycetota bacterium]RZV82988.1 MAG: hypothetical protein EX341_09370 [Candidatus Scalindua sp. SCAELEC01]TDE64491.1 MAG: hypothetical protein D8M57_12710 [Candidatus Scalindua sp. AMX11]GJQ58768.1 MAG: hypothetical protein SCALA701_15690 [Candidatus Scalindua sp.]
MTDSKRENVLAKDIIPKQDVMEIVKGFGMGMTPHTGTLWTSFSRNYYKLQNQMRISNSKRGSNDHTLPTTFKKPVLSNSTKEETLCGVSH